MSGPASTDSPSSPILPGATLGVMGGGQLGRMFVHAAQRLGYFTAVLDADPQSPAGLVSHHHIQTGYSDPAGLAQLAALCAAVHFSACAAASGVACAPYAVLQTPEHLSAVPATLLPGILKTARMGYDGKGQVRVKTAAELAAAWGELKQEPCVLEKMLPLKAELSVLVARGRDGQVVSFAPQRNVHVDGILAVTHAYEGCLPPVLAARARAATEAIAAQIGYVGLMCVEFFVVTGADGQDTLVVNEMAPRPHNSGHYTMDACDFSQFDLQVHAMAGLPLPRPRQHSPAIMLNLLGDIWFDSSGRERTPDWCAVLALPGAHLHLYGKTEARRGRKMGHLTLTGADLAGVQASARAAAALLDLPGIPGLPGPEGL